MFRYAHIWKTWSWYRITFYTERFTTGNILRILHNYSLLIRSQYFFNLRVFWPKTKFRLLKYVLTDIKRFWLFMIINQKLIQFKRLTVKYLFEHVYRRWFCFWTSQCRGCQTSILSWKSIFSVVRFINLLLLQYVE